MMTHSKTGGEQRYDFDEKTKAHIKSLWSERIKGRYQNDREGFAKAFLELSETATYDKTKPLGKATPFTTNQMDPDTTYN